MISTNCCLRTTIFPFWRNQPRKPCLIWKIWETIIRVCSLKKIILDWPILWCFQVWLRSLCQLEEHHLQSRLYRPSLIIRSITVIQDRCCHLLPLTKRIYRSTTRAPKGSRFSRIYRTVSNWKHRVPKDREVGKICRIFSQQVQWFLA